MGLFRNYHLKCILLKGIIFDFDGVIVESVQYKSDAFAELYKPYGLDIAKKVINHHEANGGISRFEKFQFYHATFLNKTITQEELSALTNQFSSLVVKKVIAAPYVPGALKFIQKYYDNHKLFISTGTPIEEINQILEKRSISCYFTEVFGSPEKKKIHVKKILNKYNLKPDELIFYGDSNSDLEAADHLKIPFVLIKSRFNQTLSNSFEGKIVNNFMELI